MEHSNIPDELNKLSNEIIGLAIKVHRALGPGLLESSYQECLCYELVMAGYLVEKEKALPLIYEDVKLDIGYRLDILVDNKIIIEIKAVESVTDVHMAQVLTYLKLSGNRIGLLINFNVKLLKDGIKRLVL
ncbi:MAG: GxxExxY protein [Chitinophagaceae bacterium]|nr:GxxExxY protein [Chitinophagaceae bacterium]